TKQEEKQETKEAEKKEEPKQEVKEEPKSETSSDSKEESSTPTGRFYSPLVMNIAKENGIGFSELESISGTGKEGRVSKKDILDYLENRGAKKQESKTPEQKQESKPETKEEAKQESGSEAKPEKKKPVLPKFEVDYDEEGLSIMEFDNIRQKMAEHMVASVHTSPHVNAIAEVDMSRVDKIRKEMNREFPDKEGFKMSYMPFIAEAVVKALKDFPLVNAIIDDSSVPYKAIMRNKINLGMAVAMENGGL